MQQFNKNNTVNITINKRKVSESIKKRIAGKQKHKCANKPGKILRNLNGYDCPLWKINDIDGDKGYFDENGYQIDHIIEFCISGDDSEDNLQALCVNCHGVKTKRFMNYKYLFRKKSTTTKNVIKQNYKLPRNQLSQEQIDILIDTDLSHYDINKLLITQGNNKLDELEFLVLKKHKFINELHILNNFNENEMRDFFDNYICKEHLFYRFQTLFGYIQLSRATVSDEQIRIQIIIDFVNRLTNNNFTTLNIADVSNITIDHIQYKKAIKNISNKSIYFKNESTNRALFFKNKNIPQLDFNTNKNHYIRTIKSLLKSYNINFGILKRIRQGAKLVYTYSLSVDKQIKNIIDKKYNL